MNPTTVVSRSVAAGVDWAHVLLRQAHALVTRTPPDEFRRVPLGARTSCLATPIVLIPGIWEPWRYLRPLAAFLHATGHPVHPLTALGWNGSHLDEAACHVLDYLERRDLRGVVLVAHSKGGLIGKKVLMHPDLDGRAVGLVAVCTPFGGSSLSFGFLSRTPLGVFNPTGRVIAALAGETEVNRRITSIGSAWDQMIPEGSILPGARNLTLGVAGHFRPIDDPDVQRLIHDQVHDLVDDEGTQSVQVTAIAAVGRNGAIGLAGDVPWHLPADWKRFQRVTRGASLIMGRKTFESIGPPLPGRTSIVLTRDPEGRSTDTTGDGDTRVVWVSSLAEALGAASPDRPLFVAGGAEIYQLAWDLLTDLDITEVDAEPDADTFFPSIDPDVWEETSRTPHVGYSFVTYRRR